MVPTQLETSNASRVWGTRRRLLTLLTALPGVAVVARSGGQDGLAKRRRKHRKRKRRVPLLYVQVQLTATQSIPSDASTVIRFNQIMSDTHRSSVDLATSQIVIPVSGYYVVNAQMPWRGTDPGERQGFLVKNETTTIAVGDGIANAHNGFTSYPYTALFLAAGDRISLHALQTTQVPVDVPGAVLWVLLQRSPTGAT